MDKIRVQDVSVSIMSTETDDYISLTDMALGRGDESRAADVIKSWMRTKNTIEYLGAWEQLYNPNFKVVDFDHFRNEAGSNSFVLSTKEWVESTNAIGIVSKQGRGGGTYAHKDIAFEFGSWISPMFKLYLIKEYQRLKISENDTYNLEWNVRRVLTKANYHFHTDAVQKHIIPKSSLPVSKRGIEYAREADLLNLAVFGYTAKDWKKANPKHVKNGLNMRDFASINELTVMSNIESMNAEMIKLGGSKSERFKILKTTSAEQLEKLKKMDLIKSVRKQSERTYIDAQDMSGEELEQKTSESILNKNQQALSDFNKKLNKGLKYNPREEEK